MTSLRDAVERSWTGERGWKFAALLLLTAPLSWLWGAVTAWRNRRHDRRPATPIEGIRVISIGNLAVGGTGKTPVSGWVVDALLRRGSRPGVVVSGYGEDELLLHRRWHPDVPVFADRDRASAVGRARAAGAGVAVLDDGFQHRSVARDLDVVLLAAEHPFPGHVMPRGPYREPPEVLRRASAVVITRRTADVDVARQLARSVEQVAPGKVVAGVALLPGRWVDAGGHDVAPPSGPLLAVCAVARPRTFEAQLRAAVGEGTDIVLRGFPDHHDYSEADMRRIVAEAEQGRRTLVSTEKDGVKLARLAPTPPSMCVLCSRIHWDWGEDAFDQLLDSAVEESE